MRPLGAMVLTMALLALGGPPARTGTDDDPEPPPPVKAEARRGAKVKVVSGKGGPIVQLTTDPAAMAKAKAKGGKAKLKTATASCQITFTEKEGPARLTFQFKSHARLTSFSLNSLRVTYRLSGVGASGEEVHYASADASWVTDPKNAVLTVTVAPRKDHLEVRVERAKGQSWPETAWTLTWRGPIAAKP